jgi:hypothetical protein
VGIENIHFLVDISTDADRQQRLELAALQEQRIEEHRRGEHPWGRMRRECPLCQAEK